MNMLNIKKLIDAAFHNKTHMPFGEAMEMIRQVDGMIGIVERTIDQIDMHHKFFLESDETYDAKAFHENPHRLENMDAWFDVLNKPGQRHFNTLGASDQPVALYLNYHLGGRGQKAGLVQTKIVFDVNPKNGKFIGIERAMTQIVYPNSVKPAVTTRVAHSDNMAWAEGVNVTNIVEVPSDKGIWGSGVLARLSGKGGAYTDIREMIVGNLSVVPETILRIEDQITYNHIVFEGRDTDQIAINFYNAGPKRDSMSATFCIVDKITENGVVGRCPGMLLTYDLGNNAGVVETRVAFETIGALGLIVAASSVSTSLKGADAASVTHHVFAGSANLDWLKKISPTHYWYYAAANEPPVNKKELRVTFEGTANSGKSYLMSLFEKALKDAGITDVKNTSLEPRWPGWDEDMARCGSDESLKGISVHCIEQNVSNGFPDTVPVFMADRLKAALKFKEIAKIAQDDLINNLNKIE